MEVSNFFLIFAFPKISIFIYMAKNSFLRYVWLVDFLSTAKEKGASFDEINEAWQDSPLLNPEEEPLSKDTFNKHKAAIRDIFGIKLGTKTVVTKEKMVEGENTKVVYKYYIAKENDDRVSKHTRELLSSLLQSIQVEQNPPLKKRVFFEDDEYPNSGKANMVNKAISKGKKIFLTYKKYGKGEGETERLLSPYCLKLFKRRWYLLAKENDNLKIFALDDRTKNIRMSDETFDLPDGFDTVGYFRKAFGTITGEPEKILVKTFGLETDYWRSVRLHETQQEVEKREDTGRDYSIFELYLYPYGFEFMQELFSRIDQIEILAPPKLRNDFLSYIDKVKARYEQSE